MPGLSGSVALDVTAAVYALNTLKNAMQDVVSVGINFDSKMAAASIGLTNALEGNAKAAQALLKDLRAFADISPFEMSEVAPLAQRLLAMQIPAKQLKQTLMGIGEQTAALGASADTFKMISIAMGQMNLKGQVMGQEIRQLAEHGVPAIQYLSKAWNVSNEEMKALIQQGLIPGKQAVQALAEQMAASNFDAMKKQSFELGGALSTLRDNFKFFVGGELKDTYNWLTNVINRLNVLSRDKEMQNWLQRMSANFKSAFSIAGEILRWYWDTQKRVWTAFGEAIKWSGGALTKWVGVVWDTYKSAARAAAWWADTSTWLLQKGLGGAGDFFSANLEKGIGAVETKLGDLKKNALDGLSFIGVAWSETWGNMPDFAAKWEEAGRKVEQIKKQIGERPKTTDFSGQFLNNGKAATAAMKRLLSEQKKMLEELARDYESFRGIALDLISQVRGFGQESEVSALKIKLMSEGLGHIDPAARKGAEGLAQIVDRMKEITGLRDAVSSLVQDMESTVIDTGGAMFKPFYAQVKKIESFLNVPERLKSLLGSAGGLFSDVQANVTANVNTIHAKTLVIDNAIKGLSKAANGPTSPPAIRRLPPVAIQPAPLLAARGGSPRDRALRERVPLTEPKFPGVGRVLAPADPSKFARVTAPKATETTKATTPAKPKVPVVDWSKVAPPDFAQSFTAYIAGKVKGIPKATPFNETRRETMKTFASVDWQKATQKIKPEDRQYLEGMLYAAANTADLGKLKDAQAAVNKATRDFATTQRIANDVTSSGNAYIRAYGANSLQVAKQEELVRFALELRNNEELKSLTTKERTAEINKRLSARTATLNTELRSNGWREHIGRVEELGKEYAGLNDQTVEAIAQRRVLAREDAHLLTQDERRLEIQKEITLEMGKATQAQVDLANDNARRIARSIEDAQSKSPIEVLKRDWARRDADDARKGIFRGVPEALKISIARAREMSATVRAWNAESLKSTLETVKDLLKDADLSASKIAATIENIGKDIKEGKLSPSAQIAMPESFDLLNKAFARTRANALGEPINDSNLNNYGQLLDDIVKKAANVRKDAAQSLKEFERSELDVLGQAKAAQQDLEATIQKSLPAIIEGALAAKIAIGPIVLALRQARQDAANAVENAGKQAEGERLKTALAPLKEQRLAMLKQIEEAALESRGRLTELAQQNLDWKFEDKALKQPRTERETAQIEEQRNAIRGLMRDWEAYYKTRELVNIGIEGMTNAFSSMFDAIVSKQKSWSAALMDGLRQTLFDMAKEILASRVRGLLMSVFGSLLKVPKAFTPAGAYASPAGPPAASFATGISRVPVDEMPAKLHKNEAVLTAPEAHIWREMKAQRTTSTATSSNRGVVTVVNITHNGNIVANDPTSYRRQMQEMARSRGPRLAQSEVDRNIALHGMKGRRNL